MNLSLNLNLGPAPDSVALEQFFAWAAKLDVGFATMEGISTLHVADKEGPKPNGAAEPEPAQQAAPEPATGRVRGRPRGTGTAAAQTAAIANAAAASAGGPGPAIPPGMAMPAATQPQEPAMPKAPAGADGASSLEDLRACLLQANGKDPKLAFQIMRRKAWSDGTEKPSWFTAESVQAEHRERLIEEISIAASA